MLTQCRNRLLQDVKGQQSDFEVSVCHQVFATFHNLFHCFHVIRSRRWFVVHPLLIIIGRGNLVIAGSNLIICIKICRNVKGSDVRL